MNKIKSWLIGVGKKQRVQVQEKNLLQIYSDLYKAFVIQLYAGVK